jgi:hypothetical protein
MKPEDLCKGGTEHGHQMALFCWANQHVEQWPVLKWMYAIPNGGERNIIVAASLKAEGVKSGVSDVCLPVAKKYPNNEVANEFNGLYIEMKKPNGKESKEQKDFGAFVQQQGYAYHCCDHWEKARDVLIAYLT